MNPANAQGHGQDRGRRPRPSELPRGEQVPAVVVPDERRRLTGEATTNQAFFVGECPTAECVHTRCRPACPPLPLGDQAARASRAGRRRREEFFRAVPPARARRPHGVGFCARAGRQTNAAVRASRYVSRRLTRADPLGRCAAASKIGASLPGLIRSRHAREERRAALVAASSNGRAQQSRPVRRRVLRILAPLPRRQGHGRARRWFDRQLCGTLQRTGGRGETAAPAARPADRSNSAATSSSGCGAARAGATHGGLGRVQGPSPAAARCTSRRSAGVAAGRSRIARVGDGM
jgi:hypothetical protein